jgi:hypothetical protein
VSCKQSATMFRMESFVYSVGVENLTADLVKLERPRTQQAHQAAAWARYRADIRRKDEILRTPRT